MTGHDFATLMYQDGHTDGADGVPCKYADVPEYSVGYALGEGERFARRGVAA